MHLFFFLHLGTDTVDVDQEQVIVTVTGKINLTQLIKGIKMVQKNAELV